MTMTAMKRRPRTSQGRALARAQELATELAALPLERGTLPEFRRLGSQLLEQLDRARMLPAALECDNCGDRRDECTC